LGGDFNEGTEGGSCDLLRNAKIPLNHVDWAEGSIFNDVKSETQDERETNWHHVMTQKTIRETRKLFTQLSTKGFIAPEKISSLLIQHSNPSAGAGALSPNTLQLFSRYNHFCYAQFFQAISCLRLENFSDWDKVMEVLSTGKKEEGEDNQLIVSIGCCEYPRAEIGLGIPMKGIIEEGYITYYAGINPKAETVDHVFYTEKDFKFMKLLPSFTEEMLASQGGIPSRYFPSDHISVVVDFDWVNNKI